MIKMLPKRLLLLTSFLVLGACASAPKPVDALDQVNVAYQKASTDPVVLEHASLELSDAKDELGKANEIWKSGEKTAVVEQQASVAAARIEYAQTQAAARQSKIEQERLSIASQQAAMTEKEKEIEATRKETLALKYQLLELNARKTDRGLQMTLNDDLFVPAETALSGGALEQVRKVARFMKENEDRSILVEGHSDNHGDPDWSFDLSAGRAGEVAAALVDEGISLRRIKTKAYGGEVPVADNETVEGRMQNRRVEIIFPEQGNTLAGADG